MGGCGPAPVTDGTDGRACEPGEEDVEDAHGPDVDSGVEERVSDADDVDELDSVAKKKKKKKKKRVAN